MTFTPKRSQLRGLSVDIAELYGKPHIGSFYARDEMGANRLEEGALCCMCGMPATNSHHVPPRSKGRFLLCTQEGDFDLLPSLFAVCGSGTTGCHGAFHGGARFRPRWIWERDGYAELWWSGHILGMHSPHSDAIYAWGHWEVYDASTDRTVRVGWL